MAALEAGVRTIEHGTYLDEEAAEAMTEASAVLVPTRFIVEYLAASGKAQGMPDYASAKIAALADRHFEAMQTAVASGVRMALGTDIFVTGVVGRNGEELGHLVRAGLTPLQAIEAATATGPLTVGPQAPRTGVLEAGFDADIIALATDPLEDIGVLADPRRVLQVWKRGVACKG
jgi:imidazolonepropionase-like amidohydrolase